jgi:hypothetical protein
MMTPQLTEQYGHVLRVSVVRSSLNGRTEAASACSLPANPSAPSVDPLTTAPVPFRNERRETSMDMSLPFAARSPLQAYAF